MTKKPHVVLACQVFYPDAQSTSQLFTQLFEALAAAGDIDLTVICGFPSAIRVGSGPVPKSETWNGIRIIRCGMQVDVKRNMLTRMLSYASFLLGTFWRLLRVPRDAVIVGVTNPPFMGILLWALSCVRGMPYQYNIQDLYPEGLYHSGILKQGSLIGRAWEFFNRCTFRRAQRLLILGRDMAPLLQSRYHVDPQKLLYLPHWSAMASAVHAPTPENNPLAQKLGLQGKFIVQYSGNMGLWHDLDPFIHAAAALKDDPRIAFLFIGAGRRRKAAQALAEKIGANNILWQDFVPREELPVSLACCHVSLVSLRAGLQGIAVPCKIYGILASARPMIAQVPDNSEVAMVVREENCGIVVPTGDAGAVVQAIQKLANDRDLARQMGERGFAAYRKKYSLDTAVREFRELWTQKPV